MSEEKDYINEEKQENSFSGIRMKKKNFHIIRILMLVVIFCVAVFGTIVISDLILNKDDSTASEPEIIIVTVSGKEILLNDNKTLSYAELKNYFDSMEKAGDLFAVALINDMENPADYLVYNSIVDLLSQYDIICEKLPKPASYDESAKSTYDETPYV